MYIEIDGGYGGYYWEALALKTAYAYKGIVFEGENQVIFDDHLVGTTYSCDGNEVTQKRYIKLPNDFDDEADEEEERAFFEEENDVPYLVKFSVEEVISCIETYNIVNKKLKDSALVEAACAEHKIPKDRFLEFATIITFKKR